MGQHRPPKTDHQVEATAAEDKAEPQWEGEGAELPCPRGPCCTGGSEGIPSQLPPRIPILRFSPCLHRSPEGLNQELEEVFVKEQGEEELLRVLEVPDGHRAPAPPQNSSCDHPLLLEPGNLTSSPSMLPASIHSNKASSPGRPAFLEDGSPSPALSFAASPQPSHSYVFKREPPEGCERVHVFEEVKSPGPDLACLTSCPDKNKVHFNRTGSAFCPVSLIKPLFSSRGSIFCHCPSSPGSPFPPASPRVPPRKDPEASKASSLPFEPWQRTPPSEESVLFQSSLVV